MNIDVVRIHFKDKGDDEYSYKYLPFEYCDEKDNTVPGFSIWREEPQAWEELPESCYYRIGYCPFCGQKININIAREEDKSYQYAVMSALRDSKNELSLKTDSKSEYDRLYKEMRELDGKLNEFWNFGEYHGEQSENS